METLRTLSNETDGRAIVNRNDLVAGMKQIVKDTSAYYLLGYNSTQAPRDGKFKVRVKRPGIQVRARRGYWAMTADDAARALAPPKPAPPKAVESALSTITQPTRSRVVRTWIGTERGANGKTRVTFVWEPAPKTPGEPARQSAAPARVSVTAVAPDGSPYFRGRVPGTASTTTSMPARVVFDAQPGKMQLRLSVEGETSEVIDSEIREIDVPDLTTPQTSLGTPEVFRARTVREVQQLKSDAQAVPIAAREFTRTDRLLIRVPAYASDGAAPKVAGKLLNRAGKQMSELVVAPAATGGTSELDVPLASLPPGEYLIEITATGSGAEAKELVGFRIVG
jgi:hypothetical protein